MELIYIAGEILWLAIVVVLIIGQARLGKRIEKAQIEADFAVAFAEQIEMRVIQNEKKPAVRKAAVKKEVK